MSLKSSTSTVSPTIDLKEIAADHPAPYLPSLPPRAWTLFGATLVFWGAFGARLLLSLVTVAPDRDTAWYVYMAKGIQGGQKAWWESVFPPLHPFLLALLGPFPGTGPEDWWLGGQVLCSLEGALAAGCSYWVFSRKLGPVLASFVALTLGFGFASCGTAADGLTEPLFQLILVLGMGSLLRSPKAWAFPSFFLGLLPLVRPEGLVILPWVWKRAGSKSFFLVFPSLVFSLGPRAVYLLLRYQATGDASLFPKGSFMWHLSAFSEDGFVPAFLHWLREFSQFVGQGFYGAGFLAWPLFLGAIVWLLRKSKTHHHPFLLPAGLLLFALLVVPIYHANRRFFVGWLPLLLFLASLPFLRQAKEVKVAILAIGVLALLPGMTRFFHPRRAVLAPDRALGMELRKRLPKEGGIATDLPRLLFFSGRPPLPPRHISARDLRTLAKKKKTVAVVSLKKRKKLDAAFLRGLGYLSVSPKEWIKSSAFEESRGLQLFIRETVMVK